MMNQLRKITEVLPALALFGTIVGFVVGFYASQAVADHDAGDKSHAVMMAFLTSKIQENTSKATLQLAKYELTKEQDIKTHAAIEKKFDRVLTVLDRMESKIDDL